VRVMFDPQFGALATAGSRIRFLTRYPYFRPNLRLASLRGRYLRQLVEDVLGFQAELPVDRIIAPALTLRSFTDRASLRALDLMDESAEVHASLADPPPLLLSLVFEDHVLGDLQRLGEFLDELVLRQVAGFYLLVHHRSKQYSQRIDPGCLAGLMYMVYVLGQRHGMEVICGYTDLLSMVLGAVGATSCASGWSQNLRRFSDARFGSGGGGGHRPRRRYTALPMLNSLLLSELDNCLRVNALGRVLSGGPHDGVFAGTTAPSQADWTPDTEARHHWWVLSRATAAIRAESLEDRLAICADRIRRAQRSYDDLAELGVPFDTAAGTNGFHLQEWADGILGFCSAAGLPPPTT